MASPAARPATPFPFSLFARGLVTGGDRHKGQRAKREGLSGEEGGEAEVVEGEATAVPEKSAAEKRAAREAKKARKAASVAAAAEVEREQRRAKKEAQKAASTRAEQRAKAEVIEKEVPLMDLEGLKPGQNKYQHALDTMRAQGFPDSVIAEVAEVGDYATASTREILSARLANLREKYGRKPHDTGSPEVQVAMLTERLKGYDQHMLVHRSDISSRRGFLAAWHRRRKLLKYLRRTKYDTYAYIMRELNLNEADIDTVGLSRTSGTQAARIKKD